jgi:glycosyltransferase involved in cell wall biosynthesis
MNGLTPLVTIGVPVYNGERYLAEALDSALAQDYPSLEILIADNASTDATPDICRRYAAADPRVRWWKNDVNRGFGHNFALLVEQARGVYFTWLSHDDVLSSPRYVSTLAAYLDAHPDVVLCTSSFNLLDLEGPGLATPAWLKELYDTEDWPRARRRLFQSGHRTLPYAQYGVFRREAMADVRSLVVAAPAGGLITALPESAFLTTAALRGRVVALPALLRTYRFHPDSTAKRYLEAVSARAEWTRRFRRNRATLRCALTAPVPPLERARLVAVALGNFVRDRSRPAADPRRQIRELKRELLALRRAAEEQRAVIARLTAERDAARREQR